MADFYILNSSAPDITINEHFQGYVIWYKKNKDTSIAEVQASLFSKLIVNALKLREDNFLLIDIYQPVRLSELKKSIKMTKCFLFGVKESEIGINFDISSYKLTAVAGIEFLKVDAPEILEQDKGLKNKLWEQLQLSFKTA